MATRTDVTKVQRIEIGVEPVAWTAPFRLRAPIVAAILMAAVAVGAVLTSTDPSAEKLEQAHWQAVVDYYGERYQTMAVAGASEAPSAEMLEQSHWQAVVDYYGGLYQTMADAGASEAAHWQQVVDYYENQWVPRQT